MENKELIYLPHYERYIAKDSLVAKIATFLFVETSYETSTGNWCTSAEEIAEALAIPEKLVWDLEADIVEAIEECWSDMIESVETYVDESEYGEMLMFDVNLWHNAICGFIQDDACFETVEEKEPE